MTDSASNSAGAAPESLGSRPILSAGRADSARCLLITTSPATNGAGTGDLLDAGLNLAGIAMVLDLEADDTGVFELADDVPLLELDDARSLLARGLRPTQVIARNRAVTQEWALQIFTERTDRGQRRWDGCGGGPSTGRTGKYSGSGTRRA